MAKTTGLGDNFYLDGYDVSGDIGSIQTIQISRQLLDVTGIDKDAHERLPGLGDSEISFNNWFNPSTTVGAFGIHSVVKEILNERHCLYFRGTALGNPVAALIGAQANYNVARGNDGSLSGSVQVMNAGGRLIEWGISLTAGKHTAVAAGNLAGVMDPSFPQGSTSSISAYLQVFSITGSAGDDIALKLQHSDYNNTIAADDDAIRTVTNLTNTTLVPNGAGFTGTVEARRVTVTIVDTTPSIVAGTVQIVGTDSRGNALTETVDIGAGAGLYTTTKFFRTVTSVVVAGVTVLGGAGDETIKVGVEAAAISYTDISSGAFTAVDIAAAPAKERITRSGTVKRYMRAVLSTVDGFDETKFAIAVKRY